MENKNDFFDLCPSIKEMSKTDLEFVNGGRFAYDMAFLVREFIVNAVNGGGVNGTLAVAADVSMYYRPV